MFFLDSFDSFHLDIVGFLAILGEGSIEANYQAATLSNFILLPRLLPAPQVFLKPSRPLRLDVVPGTVIGTRSGAIRHDVNRIPHILLGGDTSMKVKWDYSVRRLSIDRVPKKDFCIRTRPWGPLSLLSILGCAMSIALLVLSIHFNDGWALVATILLSCLSTVAGLGSRWSLELGQRRAIREVPKSDVVVQYPNGSFLIVHCDENIARALFFTPERCKYWLDSTWYRLIALPSTLMLMFGVIGLGNASECLQIAFGAAYLILNATYWLVAALPEEVHWQLSCLKVTPHEVCRGKNFTEALWNAIRITGTAQWVHIGQVAPVTEAWKQWLQQAEDAANGPDPGNWDFETNLTECLANFHPVVRMKKKNDAVNETVIQIE